MRKALMGILMTATMATPLAAAPFEGGRVAKAEQSVERGQRGAERDRARPARAERREQRSERRAVRAERNRTPAASPQMQVRRDAPQTQANRPTATQRAERAQRVERVRTGDRDRQRRAERPRESMYGGSPENVRHYQELERRNQQRYGNDRRDDRRDWRDDRRDDRADRRDDRRDWRSDRRDHRDWNRNWRNDRRYDWQRYRYSNRNIFRPGRYYAPYRGYGYSRFSIGLFLDQGFYSRNYWINDPWQYRLPPAYAGTRWVRYYDDVLLVDMYTGEVIDVIYDFFW